MKDLAELKRYEWCGHSVIMGVVKREWQDKETILAYFGKRRKRAIEKYEDFVEDGIKAGSRPELIGGGLIRSLGGWSNLIEMRRAKVFVKGDERILGGGEFVEQMLEEAGEAFEKKSQLKTQGWNIDKLAVHVAGILDMDISVSGLKASIGL